ncbi:hypothetical protein TorRG33x02_220640, partial [Trema orientale]
ADPIHTYVGLGRLSRAEIVVIWTLSIGVIPSKDARPLTRGDCNASSPTSSIF